MSQLSSRRRICIDTTKFLPCLPFALWPSPIRQLLLPRRAPCVLLIFRLCRSSTDRAAQTVSSIIRLTVASSLTWLFRFAATTARGRRTGISHNSISPTTANDLRAEVLPHIYYYTAPPTKAHQRSRSPSVAASAIQKQHDSSESLENPTAQSTSLHAEAVQNPSAILRPQMATSQHACNYCNIRFLSHGPAR